MNSKAVLTITGRQRLDDTHDKVELTTVGTVEETDDKFIIRYNEEQEPPENPVHVTVKVFKDENTVHMIRSGSQSSLLIIEKGKRNLCQYGTPYGDIMMGIYGKSIENSPGSEEGAFNFGYDIDVNGSLTSQNEVRIDYRINS